MESPDGSPLMVNVYQVLVTGLEMVYGPPDGLQTALDEVEIKLALAIRNWQEVIRWLRARDLWDDDRLFQELSEPDD